jgi:hypothetical protein
MFLKSGIIYCTALIIFAVFSSVIYISCGGDSTEVIVNKEDGQNSSIEFGSFEIIALPDSIRSCGGGGGVFILFWQATDNINDNVKLSIIGDSSLHSALTNTNLTIYKRVSEVSIKPNSKIKTGIYDLNVIASHNSKTDTIKLRINMYGSEWGGTNYQIHSEFIQWINQKYPKLIIKPNDDWFCYYKAPGLMGGGEFGYICNKWDMTILTGSTPQEYYTMYLRERNQLDTIMEAIKKTDGSFQTISLKSSI